MANRLLFVLSESGTGCAMVKKNIIYGYCQHSNKYNIIKYGIHQIL